MGGEVKESTYKGFLETFDPSTHHVAAAHVNARLASATVRDEKGNFRVRPGSSLLRAKDAPEGPRGVSLARLQAEAEAEARAREEARKKKRKKEAHDTDGDKRARADDAAAAAAHAPVAPPDAGWLMAGLVVKVLAKQPPELYKAKGVVRGVLQGGASAQIELLDGGAVHELPASQLETVLPRPGGKVMLLAGRHRGARAVLDGIDEAAFKADVRLLDAPNEGLQVRSQLRVCAQACVRARLPGADAPRSCKWSTRRCARRMRSERSATCASSAGIASVTPHNEQTHKAARGVPATRHSAQPRDGRQASAACAATSAAPLRTSASAVET